MSKFTSVSLSLTAHQKLNVLAQPQPQKQPPYGLRLLALVNGPAKEAVPPLTTFWHLGSLAAVHVKGLYSLAATDMVPPR